MPTGSASAVRGYTLRRFLAQGGMAELFLAQPTDPARAHNIVVVKRVLPQFVQDQQFARMFAREAALASMLKHPNIVEVFDDRGATEAECFFAMEYVHGPDLNMLLKELKDGTTPVPLEHAVQIAMGMCLGLHHAHEHRGDDGQLLSIVHRDVSPSNVMIAADGTVKITDFGVAKALALTSFTQAGTRKGKLSYMSPEQAVADPVDRRTDVFAIGTVLFEMTTLQRMFGGENELAIMHKLLFRERPRPSAIRHDYPPELESIVLKAVAQKPDERFASAYEMYQALHAFAERRGLNSSSAHLAQWVAGIIPPTQHPAQDPAFFTAHASATVLPLQRETVVAADMQATISDSGRTGHATVLDGAPSPIAAVAVAGQLQASAPSQPISIAPPQGPTFTPPPPAAGSGTSVVRRAPAQSSTLPAIAIVAGALAVGAVILAGALWYADARKREAASPESTTAPATEAVVESPVPPQSDTPPPGLIEPDPPPTTAPAAAPDPQPVPTADTTTPTTTNASASAPETKKRRGKKRRASKPKTDPAPKPQPKQKPEPAVTPKPDPKPKPKPTNTLDELFPGM